MRLTLYTDYSLRVLLYLASVPEKPSSIREVADAYGISQNHLHKIVNDLARHGYLQTTRGRHGGISLGKRPGSIVLGTLVRLTEPDFRVLECLDKTVSKCPIDSVCTMRHILIEALEAFLKTLDQYTLADLLGNASLLRTILIDGTQPESERRSTIRSPGDRIDQEPSASDQ